MNGKAEVTVTAPVLPDTVIPEPASIEVGLLVYDIVILLYVVVYDFKLNLTETST